MEGVFPAYYLLVIESLEKHNHTHETCNTTSSEEEFVLVLSVVIPVLAILGNSVVIFVFVANKISRTSTNWIITNLATADLLCALTILTSQGIPGIEKPTGTGLNAHLYCVYFCAQYPTWMFFNGSICNLILITIDRYLAVVFPLFHRTIFKQKRFLLLQLSVTWIIPPCVSMYGLFIYTAESDDCEITFNHAYVLWGGLWGFFGMLIVPTVFMMIAYTHLISTLRSIASNADGEAKKRRVTISCFAVCLLFFVCWLPLETIVFLHATLADYLNVELNTWYYRSSTLFGFLNCALNPYMYALLNPNYKKAIFKSHRLKQLFGVRRKEGASVNDTRDTIDDTSTRDIVS